MSKRVEKADGAHRDAAGKFKPGHRLGGRGSRRGPMTEAFADAGVSLAEARRLVIAQTVKNARKGVDAAVERLARLVLPATRATPNVFNGATTAHERAEAVIAALDTGAITPQEAALIAKGPLETLAAATEWKALSEKLEQLDVSPQPALPAVRVLHVDEARTVRPGRVVDATIVPTDHDGE